MGLTVYDKNEIIESVKGKLERYFGCEVADATRDQIYHALASTVRDQVMERRTSSRGERKRQKAKKVYYLSAEFLIGRAMHNNMINLLNESAYVEAMKELGIDMLSVAECEPEPGLGNGGLGRLAACFMDSLATLDLPAMGCSIRYEYGLFQQKIVNGFQVEMPDNWLKDGNIWEICKPSETVEVHFGGYIEEDWSDGTLKVRHRDYNTVLAVPYDVPILGYDTVMVDMLRLWSARSPKTIDMDRFNRGQYTRSMEEKELAEVISKVLYPDDNHIQGKELRLKQQYFFSSASVQYALNDFEKVYGPDWDLLPQKIAMHINDTHPGLAIPEMMRILIDEKGLDWERAERLVRGVFAYTNHTVMSEALERWPEDLVKMLVPRIYSILVEMNRRLCDRLWKVFTGQWNRIGNMAIISYGNVQMANLCVSMSHHVNGVSQIHAEILKNTTFSDYCKLNPDKFMGITNGITHRRWLMMCNRGLSGLLDETIGEGWRKDALQLSKLMPYTDDAAFLERFKAIKQENKRDFANWLKARNGIVLDPDSIFDVQAKRLHEYKRQLMNALHILVLYNRIVNDPNYTFHPVTFIFAAKAAPGYERAKSIIKLINSISDLVKKNKRASELINIVFVENYCVSAAEMIIPAAEVSQQISTAGKEASGTGNMKFMMNGAVTIGTMDGANVEIFNEVGADNIYIFGMRKDEVEALYRAGNYRSSDVFESNYEVRRAMEQLIDGTLCPENPRIFQDIYHSLLFGGNGSMADEYLVLNDLGSYMQTHERLLNDYGKQSWWHKAAVNTAASGIFSSDRTIREYNERIWHLKPLDL
ncbi:MAG: glycogen/starch/alpha-glucan phosphorylase [Candidatus Fimadaptatus sp.]|jgi:starch phosphorylase